MRWSQLITGTELAGCEMQSSFAFQPTSAGYQIWTWNIVAVI